MTPYFEDQSLTVYGGDCRAVMREMASESVHCVVTSPPYWGLRDYGTATWTGGRDDCGHKGPDHSRNDTTNGANGHFSPGTRGTQPAKAQTIPYRAVCGKCGALRIDAQLGLESTPEAYVESLVAVFREVRRVLRADGTVWLNLGDSYAGGNKGGYWDATRVQKGTGRMLYSEQPNRRPQPGLKPKDLVGIPWRAAFALQADGWYLRSDIVWSKPNPMPESVTDRPTKAHEYVFLLSKSARYFYDADAVREAGAGRTDTGRMTTPARLNQGGEWKRDKQRATVQHGVGNGHHIAGFNDRWDQSERKQTRRAVELARAAGLTQAHLDAIRAVGITDVGKARVTQSGTGKNDAAVQALADEAKVALGGYYREFLVPLSRNLRSVWTVATAPYPGAHFATFPPALVTPCIKAGCPEGGVVLDPFAGTGTVGMVAAAFSRRAVLIDLNAEYLRQCLDRNRQAPLGLLA